MASISSCHSFIPYPVQKRLLEYYLKEERELEQTLGKKREGKYEYDKDLEEEPKEEPKTKPHWSVLQRKSMEDTEQIHAIRQGLAIQAQASKSFPKKLELGLDKDSPVRIYDAARPYRIVLDSSNKKLKTRDQSAKTCLGLLCSADTFFRKVFEFRPVRIGDQALVGYIHDQDKLNNACWNGRTFQFGDVDPRVYTSMFDTDIVVHEVGHAVVTFTSRLNYQRQSGALNESIADIFAITSKHFSANTEANAENADWDFAKIVVMDEDDYRPMRSFQSPGKAYQGHPIIGDDIQVASMTEYVHEPSPSEDNDWGGVHIYSGIPNHAFYLAAKGLQGSIWKTIGKIWFEAVIKSKPDDDFSIFAYRTIVAARKYGEGAQNEIRKAWRAVGVTPSNYCTSFIQYEKIRSFLPTLKNIPVKKVSTVTAIGILALLYKQYS